MLPSCQLPVFLLAVPPSTFALFHFPSSLPESQYFKKHWHFIVKKDSGPRRSLGINTGLQKGMKAELTSRVFNALHSALYCVSVLLQLHGVYLVSADWLHCHLSCSAQSSAAAVRWGFNQCWNTDEILTGDTLKSSLPVFLSVNLPWEELESSRMS